MGVAANVANHSLARRSIDMDAVAIVIFQGEPIDLEVMHVAEMDGEGLALPDRDVLHADAAGILE